MKIKFHDYEIKKKLCKIVSIINIIFFYNSYFVCFRVFFFLYYFYYYVTISFYLKNIRKFTFEFFCVTLENFCIQFSFFKSYKSDFLILNPHVLIERHTTFITVYNQLANHTLDYWLNYFIINIFYYFKSLKLKF